MSDDFTPTPEFERDLRTALEAPALEPAFTNRLRANLIAQAAELKPAPQPRRRALRWAYALLFILLLAIVFSPQIVTAMRRLLGYVPGVGLVEQNAAIRILAEPVKTKQNGFTVTVLKVVADSTHTFVEYGIAGIPPSQNGFPICGFSPILRLPDGSDLEGTNGSGFGMDSEGGQPMAFETDLTYAPIPADVTDLTFIVPCILPTPGTGPENWEIPLKLVPAPADFATPAVEIGATFESSGPKFATTPTATPAPPSAPLPEATLDFPMPPTPTTVPNGSGLYLDKVVEMEKSYLLIGNFTDAGDLPGVLEVSSASDYEYRLKFISADGKQLLAKQRTDIQPEINWGSVYYWAYEVPKPVKGPLKITLEHINLHTSDTVQFQFDTGPNPQVGQEWQLNQPIRLKKYDYIIDTAKMLKKGYLFHWHSGPEVPEGTSFTLDLPGIPRSTTESGWGMEDRSLKDRVKYGENFLVDGPVPTGILKVELTLHESVSLPGPWTITWSPPQP